MPYAAPTVRALCGLAILTLCLAPACSDDGGGATGPAATDTGAADAGPSDAGSSGSDAAADTAVADTAKVDTAAADTGSTPGFDAGPRPVQCPAGATVTHPKERPSIGACEAVKPSWYAKDKVPAPSLKVVAGRWDKDGKKFVPWTNGEWAPIHWGMRMGAGVWTALRVELPGETAAKVGLELDVPGHVGCKAVGKTLTKMAYFDKVDGEPGVYIYGMGSHPGACVLLAYTPPEIANFCQAWMTIWASVRIPDTEKWGQAVNTVRLYIEKDPKP